MAKLKSYLIQGIALLIFLTFVCSCRQKQTNPILETKQVENIEPTEFYESLILLVLSENRFNKEYLMKVETEGILEYSITYLGNIVNSENDTLRFINLVTLSGPQRDTPRGNGHIFIYNSAYQYLGSYYVGGISDVPNRIVGDSLVFDSHLNKRECDQSTSIGFRDSIPYEIFIACIKTGKNAYQGDIYGFNKDK